MSKVYGGIAVYSVIIIDESERDAAAMSVGLNRVSHYEAVCGDITKTADNPDDAYWAVWNELLARQAKVE